MVRQNIANLGIMNEKERKRILSKCDGDIFGDECVIWKGSLRSKTKKGGQHGMVKFRRKTVGAHRLLYHNFVAQLTDENPLVLHRCDTDGRCVCLQHLYAGTQKMNCADRRTHGNHFRNGAPRKLSKNDVINIRMRYVNGETQKNIAASFQITQACVSLIVLGKSRRGLGE